jgi:transcriptional regulator with XRE-family HTH domain
MATEFGALFREIREDLGLSMGQVARHLGVTVTYVSDVELGKRTPFTNERILQACRLMNVNPAPLIAAAGKCRGFFEIKPTTQRHLEVGAALARKFENLSVNQLDRIDSIVEEE